MATFDELYCSHAEQLGLRYPDASHIRRAWGVDKHRIESKVYIGGDIEIFLSVITADGRIRHFAEPYKIARTNGLYERAITPQPSYGQD